MTDTSVLLTVASIVSGFGITIFTFRLQREIQMMERKSQTWIPWADRLVIAAVLVSLLLGILPLITLSVPPKLIYRIASGACTAAVVMLAGYIPAILAHYRFIFAEHAHPRDNPEPSERWIVLISTSLAIILFCAVTLGVL